jgi:hypothetical protein
VEVPFAGDFLSILALKTWRFVMARIGARDDYNRRMLEQTARRDREVARNVDDFLTDFDLRDVVAARALQALANERA